MTEPSHPIKSALSRPTQTDAKTILSLKKGLGGPEQYNATHVKTKTNFSHEMIGNSER
jgi:hypothetical protein